MTFAIASLIVSLWIGLCLFLQATVLKGAWIGAITVLPGYIGCCVIALRGRS